MVGICHLTDSHHNHHGQKPTMVGICHGGNMLGNHHHHGHHYHYWQCPVQIGCVHNITININVNKTYILIQLSIFEKFTNLI